MWLAAVGAAGPVGRRPGGFRRSPVAGLWWVIWRRNRRALTAFGLYSLAVALYVQTPVSMAHREASFALVLPLFFGLLCLMAAFAHPEADVASPHGGYPPPLLVLPVRTATLALTPMLVGGALTALAWVAVADLILQPMGVHAPVWWPAGLLPLLLATVQALSWSPMRLPYLRMLAAMALLSGEFVAGMLSYQNGVPEGTILLWCAAGCLLAGVAAVAGLARARRGDSPELAWLPARKPALSPPRPLAPSSVRRFPSPMRAQLWAEWSRNGIMLPLTVGAAGLLALLPGLLTGEMGPFLRTSVEVNLWAGRAWTCLFLPVLFAGIFGCGLRKQETRKKDLSLPLTLATRPLTSTQLVAAKLRMAALSTLAAWAVMLCLVLLWGLMPGREGERSAPAGLLLLGHATWTDALRGLLCLAAGLLLTWKAQTQSLFADLTGRAWVSTAYPMLMGAVGTFLTFAGAWYGVEPERYHRMLSYAPQFVGAGVVLKAGAALWLGRAVLAARLLASRQALLLAAGWLGLALLLFAGFRAALPPGLVTPGLLAGLILLWLPAVRLMAAPLALHWNRHR